MSKAAHISSSSSASKAFSNESRLVREQTDRHQLASVALFAGTGLLISLVAILLGVQGAWF